MRFATLVGVSVATTVLSAAVPVRAQDAIVDLSAHAAHTMRAQKGAKLARPGLTRAEAVDDALRGRHDDATLRGLVQRREHESGGVVHLTYSQQVAGFDVYGTYVRAAFDATGEL